MITDGITLVALVVTIVVLLILAGITIMYVMGDNSVFKQASKAKIQTKLAEIEERAQTIYSEKLMETASGTLNTTVSTSVVIGRLEREGYIIETRGATAADIDVSLDQSSVSMEKNKTAIVKLVLNGLDDGNVYYVKLEGKYYKMKPNKGYITIEREESTPTGEVIEPAKLTLATDSNHDTSIVTKAEVNEVENSITITSGEKYGDTTVKLKYGEKELSFTVKVEEKESDWKKIAEVAKLVAEDSTINKDTPQITKAGMTIKVGDSFYVKVEGETKLKEVIVLGFNHDELTTPNGAVTKAGISFQFNDFMTDTGHVMNSNNTNNYGWGGEPVGTNASDMRTYLEGAEGIGKFSTTLQSKIKQVKKKYLLGNKSSTVLESNDKLWLLSCSEIFSGPTGSNTGGYGYAKEKEGERYKYYINLKEEDISGHSGLIKTSSDGPSHWWLRSPYYNQGRSFCLVSYEGKSASTDAKFGENVLPGFCI